MIFLLNPYHIVRFDIYFSNGYLPTGGGASPAPLNHVILRESLLSRTEG